MLIRTGQDNQVVLKATRFEANKEDIKNVNPSKRKCYFEDEHFDDDSLKLHKIYTQSNCFFQCKIEHIRDLMSKDNNTAGQQRCVPWFYPVEDQYLYEICDPWKTAKFQGLMKHISADDICKHCFPDCTTTKYESIITSAPIKTCDRTNLGVSPLCDLTATDEGLMINPPIWKNAVKTEYETFNGGDPPDFVKNRTGVFSNIRKYVSIDQDVDNLVFRAQREKNLTYDALKEDITMVNFYFDEANIIQYSTFKRMTVIDFISSASYIYS